MRLNILRDHERAVQASAQDWKTLHQTLSAQAKNEHILAKWAVRYSALGHDIIIEARVKVINAEDNLLQVWLMDTHTSIWIPEFRPWVSSVSEFQEEQRVKKALIGLCDSKWRPEDAGQTYDAWLWGYFTHEGAVESFSFQQQFVYPG